MKAFLHVTFFNWSAILLAKQAALLFLVKLERCSGVLLPLISSKRFILAVGVKIELVSSKLVIK